MTSGDDQMIASLFEKNERDAALRSQRCRLLASLQAAAFQCPPTLTFTHLAAAQLRDSTRCLQPLCCFLLLAYAHSAVRRWGWEDGRSECANLLIPASEQTQTAHLCKRSPNCSVRTQVIPPTSATSHERFPGFCQGHRSCPSLLIRACVRLRTRPCRTHRSLHLLVRHDPNQEGS